jgi:hypothetical protein
MNKKNEISQTIEEIVSLLFSNGNTPLKSCNINEDLIFALEKEHPHVAKQYPWLQAANVA